MLKFYNSPLILVVCAGCALGADKMPDPIKSYRDSYHSISPLSHIRHSRSLSQSSSRSSSSPSERSQSLDNGRSSSLMVFHGSEDTGSSPIPSRCPSPKPQFSRSPSSESSTEEWISSNPPSPFSSSETSSSDSDSSSDTHEHRPISTTPQDDHFTFDPAIFSRLQILPSFASALADLTRSQTASQPMYLVDLKGVGLGYTSEISYAMQSQSSASSNPHHYGESQLAYPASSPFEEDSYSCDSYDSYDSDQSAESLPQSVQQQPPASQGSLYPSYTPGPDSAYADQGKATSTAAPSYYYGYNPQTSYPPLASSRSSAYSATSNQPNASLSQSIQQQTQTPQTSYPPLTSSRSRTYSATSNQPSASLSQSIQQQTQAGQGALYPSYTPGSDSAYADQGKATLTTTSPHYYGYGTQTAQTTYPPSSSLRSSAYSADLNPSASLIQSIRQQTIASIHYGHRTHTTQTTYPPSSSLGAGTYSAVSTQPNASLPQSIQQQASTIAPAHYGYIAQTTPSSSLGAGSYSDVSSQPNASLPQSIQQQTQTTYPPLSSTTSTRSSAYSAVSSQPGILFTQAIRRQTQTTTQTLYPSYIPGSGLVYVTQSGVILPQAYLQPIDVPTKQESTQPPADSTQAEPSLVDIEPILPTPPFPITNPNTPIQQGLNQYPSIPTNQKPADDSMRQPPTTAPQKPVSGSVIDPVLNQLSAQPVTPPVPKNFGRVPRQNVYKTITPTRYSSYKSTEERPSLTQITLNQPKIWNPRNSFPEEFGRMVYLPEYLKSQKAPEEEQPSLEISKTNHPTITLPEDTSSAPGPKTETPSPKIASNHDKTPSTPQTYPTETKPSVQPETMHPKKTQKQRDGKKKEHREEREAIEKAANQDETHLLHQYPQEYDRMSGQVIKDTDNQCVFIGGCFGRK